MTARLRDKMGKAAVRAARVVGYSNVGTVEFLLADGSFYFIEMNTRIQVEHGVTEMVTGVDLIFEQIRTAAGNDFTLKQSDIEFPRPRHRMPHQCREPGVVPPIARQDPALSRARRPRRAHQFGSVPGLHHSAYYNSLVGKLIVHGKTRTEALMRLKRALDEVVVDGIETTLPPVPRAACRARHHRRQLPYPLARAVSCARWDGRKRAAELLVSLNVQKFPRAAPPLIGLFSEIMSGFAYCLDLTQSVHSPFC